VGPYVSLSAELTCRTLAAAGFIERTAELVDKDSEISGRYLEFVRHTVVIIAALALEAQLLETAAFTNGLVGDWHRNGATHGEVLCSFRNLRELTESEMKKRMFSPSRPT
jgi:hypothetical protein